MNTEGRFCRCSICHARVLSVFKHLNTDELDSIDAHKKCLVFRKGDLLYKENTYPTGMFCISAGKIKLATLGENGKEHIVKLVQEGDITGENAIFSNTKHHHSAIAIEDTLACFIPKEAFILSLQNSQMMTMDVLQSLALKLENSQEKQVDLAQKTVKERLANTLLSFRDAYGESKEGFLNIKFSREEIADFIGTSTETVIRLLSEWNNNNIINISKKNIHLNEIHALNALAGN